MRMDSIKQARTLESAGLAMRRQGHVGDQETKRINLRYEVLDAKLNRISSYAQLSNNILTLLIRVCKATSALAQRRL